MEGCSDPADGLHCTFVDTVRDATLDIVVPRSAGRAPTLGEVLSCLRATDAEARSTSLDRARFADGLFLLTGRGDLGSLIPGLRFRVDGRACDPDDRLEVGPARIEIDRSRTGYPRDWPAFRSRRWKLQACAYAGFVESIMAASFGPEAESVMRLDTPGRVRGFLAAISARIYAAPYETYSRYLDPGTPFRSCDQVVDRIMVGDGGNCAEKAMAIDFLAHAYGIRSELVLGGEEASGKFPYRALRSILDRRAFADEATRDAQRHWQHYAVRFRPSDDPREDIFCDVAGSNIPYLFLDADAASRYLDPDRRTPLRVVITLEPIPLYYQPLPDRQDLPLDLYYAMEHYIESIDVIHTVDNELGLLHAGHFWVGAIASAGRREFARIAAAYERFVSKAGLSPRVDLCISRELAPSRHPLLDRFLRDHPASAGRIAAGEGRLRDRIRAARPGSQMHFVVMNLPR